MQQQVIKTLLVCCEHEFYQKMYLVEFLNHRLCTFSNLQGNTIFVFKVIMPSYTPTSSIRWSTFPMIIHIVSFIFSTMPLSAFLPILVLVYFLQFVKVIDFKNISSLYNNASLSISIQRDRYRYIQIYIYIYIDIDRYLKYNIAFTILNMKT